MDGWMDGFSSFVGGNGYLPQISSNSVQYLSEAHTHTFILAAVLMKRNKDADIVTGQTSGQRDIVET